MYYPLMLEEIKCPIARINFEPFNKKKKKYYKNSSLFNLKIGKKRTRKLVPLHSIYIQIKKLYTFCCIV